MPKARKPRREDISAVIIDKMVSSSYDFQTEDKSSGGSSTSAASLSLAIETVSSDVSVKQVKLSQDDKNKIKKMYPGLDKTKIGKLSTRTLVQEQMMKQAITQDYEHLCHSSF
ncbi:hypothetical protein PS15m_009824 [Mucor circinelloides]